MCRSTQPGEDPDPRLPDFQDAFEALPTALLLVLPDDPAFTIVACNQAFASVSGVAKEALVGKSVFAVFPENPNDPESGGPQSLIESYRRVIATRAPDQMPTYRYDVEALGPGRGESHGAGFQERHWSARNTPVFGSDGQLQYILESVEEVTERVRAEKQTQATMLRLQTSETRFRQLAETSGFGLVIGDIEGHLSYLNPTVLHLLNYTAEDVAAGLVRWDRLTPPEYAERDAEAWQEILATGKCAPYEKEYIDRDGTRIPILVSASLLEDLQGKIEVAGIIVDLTERKQSQRDAFLVQMDDAIRACDDPDAIAETAVRMLGGYLRVDRCGFGVIEAGEMLDIIRDYTQPGIPTMTGRHALPLSGDFTGPGVRAAASVSVLKAEKPVAVMFVHQCEAQRRWHPEEVELLHLAANRCWESIERARLTRALTASERRLRMSQRAGRIGSFEWLIQEERVIWTPELEALYDIPEGSFGGRVSDWNRHISLSDSARLMAEIERCIAERKAEYATEFCAMLPDGGSRWLQLDAQIFYDAAGAAERMVGVNTDINARKLAEDHLRRQWHTFDTVLSNSPDGLYTFDLQGRFTYANRAYLSRLQRSLDEVIGKDGEQLGYPPSLVEQVKRQIREIAASGQPIRDTTAYKQSSLSGSPEDIRYYEYILVPILDAEGRVEAVAGSTRDITRRKRAEERERKQQERLRESARLESLGVMAGGVAHDFNNLLTGILANASLLAEGISDDTHAIAGEIVLAAERAAGLTGQMLAYSGKGSFQVEVIDLADVIRENLVLLRASFPRNVSIELEFGPERNFIEADRAQIQQIVMNLLVNASEAIGATPGTISIRTSISKRTSEDFSLYTRSAVNPGLYSVFEVRDNGAGMNRETVNKVFDPFFTTKFTGRGLGLAAVLGIVKGHKGDLEVVSAPGVGTTFRVFLPASKRLPPVALEKPAQEPPPSQSVRHTVLVVDDEEIVRKVAFQALKLHGFDVLLANNGSEAMNMLNERSGIDLVILDLMMPVMTGEQALPLMKAKHPDLPIILSSGFNEAEISRRFASAGIAGVLPKPYSVRAIIDKVNRVMQSA